MATKPKTTTAEKTTKPAIKKVEAVASKPAKTGDEMFSTGKLAEKLGVNPPKLKKTILELGIQPDLVRCGCSYYSSATAKKIEKGLK